ncbi:hypothetical protein CEXT_442571 [Caerostris extrusa]|uniref:Uncharacterized protein n=1 Tax=Caerostris extrusa TaxID=172846 RepID=A0AAV4PD63_CAEEX|nr:hypothetical protein CEXT_442571 [Caerostris extrusa]
MGGDEPVNSVSEALIDSEMVTGSNPGPQGNHLRACSRAGERGVFDQNEGVQRTSTFCGLIDELLSFKSGEGGSARRC